MQKKIEEIRRKMTEAALRSGRSPEDVRLVAVSKTVGPEEIDLAASMGLRDFGENRTSDLKRKSQLFPDLNWHMIGRLQTNKVKDVVGRVVLIHSMDRWKLAEELNNRARAMNMQQAVLLQVNVAGEEQKAGIAPGDVEPFLDSAGQLENLRVEGLMTIAPLLTDPEQARPVFRELYQIREKMHNREFAGVGLKYLSMGMSQDFEVAIEEGANLIRVGSAIFH